MQEADALSGGLRSFPVLRGSRNCDVLVIGGGLSGLVTACRMAEKGLRTLLIEARQLGCGATAACMGMATAQLGEAYIPAANISESAAHTWAQMTQQTVREMPDILESWGIRSGLYRQKSVLYAVDESEVKRLEKLVNLEQRLQLPVYSDRDSGDCPLPVRKAFALADQLAFEPMALFTGMIETALHFGVDIYENTPARAMEINQVRSEEGSITAKYIVLATGWPIGMENPYQLSLLRQQVWITQRLTGGVKCHQGYISQGGIPARLISTPYGLMAAGCAGKPGFAKTEQKYEAIRRSIAGQLRDWSLLQETAVQAVDTAGGIPLIGPLNRNDPRLLVIAGCGINGLTQSMIASDLLVRQITGRQVPESQLFVPFGAFHQRTAMQINRRRNDIRQLAAIFRRNAPLCSHMNCRMRWNATRCLWECPCHGAAFTDGGTCRNAPAMQDASIPEHIRRK